MSINSKERFGLFAIWAISIGLFGVGCPLTESQDAPSNVLASYSTTAAGGEVPIGFTDLGGPSVAQSFVSVSGGKALTAAVHLQRVGNFTSGTQTLTASIETDNNGVPSGTAVATSGSVDPANIGSTFTSVLFTFSSPVELTAGQVYWLRIKASYAINHGNYITWAGYDGKDKVYSVAGTIHNAVYETSISNSYSSATIGQYRFLRFLIQG